MCSRREVEAEGEGGKGGGQSRGATAVADELGSSSQGGKGDSSHRCAGRQWQQMVVRATRREAHGTDWRGVVGEREGGNPTRRSRHQAWATRRRDAAEVLGKRGSGAVGAGKGGGGARYSRRAVALAARGAKESADRAVRVAGARADCKCTCGRRYPTTGGGPVWRPATVVAGERLCGAQRSAPLAARPREAGAATLSIFQIASAGLEVDHQTDRNSSQTKAQPCFVLRRQDDSGARTQKHGVNPVSRQTRALFWLPSR